MEANPYQSPVESQPADGASKATTADGRLALLPLTPWRLMRVARETSQRTARIVGCAAISLQVGLASSPDIGGISEPYADVAVCVTETVSAAIPLLGMAFLFCSAFTFGFGRLGIKRKTFVLGCWATLPIYFAWLLCHFCNVLARPSYGIISDDRMGWMTNGFVVLLGSFWCWFDMLLVLVIIAWRNKRA